MSREREQELYDEDHAAEERDAHWRVVWQRELDYYSKEPDRIRNEIRRCDAAIESFNAGYEVYAAKVQAPHQPYSREKWEAYRADQLPRWQREREHEQAKLDDPNAEWRRRVREAQRHLAI